MQWSWQHSHVRLHQLVDGALTRACCSLFRIGCLQFQLGLSKLQIAPCDLSVKWDAKHLLSLTGGTLRKNLLLFVKYGWVYWLDLCSSFDWLNLLGKPGCLLTPTQFLQSLYCGNSCHWRICYFHSVSVSVVSPFDTDYRAALHSLHVDTHEHPIVIDILQTGSHLPKGRKLFALLDTPPRACVANLGRNIDAYLLHTVWSACQERRNLYYHCCHHVVCLTTGP